MEYIIISFFILLFTLLNMLPVIVSFFHMPPGTIFIGIPHWYEDYFFYLSLIKQGAIGQWHALNWYTTEALPSYPGYWCYIFLGKINAFLQLDPWTIYNVTLFLSSLLFLFLTYICIRNIFPKKPLIRIIAFIFTVSATAFFQISYTQGNITFTPYSFYFTPTLALNRLGGTIHQLWTNILVLFYIYLSYPLFDALLKKSLRQCTKKRIVSIITIHILLFSLNPASVMIVLASFGITGIILFYQKKHWPTLMRLCGVLIVLFLISIPFLLQYMDASNHPFYQYILLSFSKTFQRITIATFFLATGAISCFAILGYSSWIKEKTPLHIFGLVFILFPSLLYLSPIPGFFNLPYERILQPGSYIFLGSLGALGLMRIAHKNMLFLTGLFTLFLLLQGVVITEEVKSRLNGIQDVYFLNTINKDLYNGINHLDKEPYGIVFGPYIESIITPALSGKPVYAAHRLLTIEYEKKKQEINNFLNLQWTPKEAQTFFQKNNITYIIVPYGKDVQDRIQTQYPFLIQRFSNPALSYYIGK